MADKQVSYIISAKDQASAQLAKIERGFGSVKNAVFSLQGAISAVGLTAVLTSAVSAASKAERANIGLAVAARYAGESIEGTLQAARALTEDGLLSMAEASQGLQNLLGRGFGLQEALTLMSRFKEAAAFNRQASLGFGEAVVSATEGLKNENSALVDNAGVTKNVSVMWREYAAEHGKSVNNLTIAEKRQAEYNGVLRETEGQLGNAARMAGTFAGEQARLSQELFNTQAAFGQALIPALNDALPLVRSLLGLVRDFVGGLQMMAVDLFALWDKFNVIGGTDINAIWNAETRAEMGRQLDIINQAAEEQKQSIADRATGPTVPDIGADTGKRRKDVVLPAPAAKVAKMDKGEWARILDQQSLDEAAAAIAGYKAQLQVKLDAQPPLSLGFGDFDLADHMQGVADNQAAAEKSSEYQAQLAERYGSLQMSLASENELIQSTYWERQSLINEALDAGIVSQAEADEMKVQLATWREDRITTKEDEEARKRMAIEQLAWQHYGQMQQGIYVFAQGQSKKMMKLYQATTIPIALANAYKAASGAMADTQGPWWLRLAAYASALGQGMQAYTAIRNVVGGGGDSSGGGAIGYGGGTPGSPIVTQPTGQTQQPQQAVTIVIQGNVIGQEKWVEEQLAPTIRELTSRNVDFGLATR